MYQQLIGGVTTQLPEAHRRRWSFYSMLPNLGIDVFPDQMDFFQVLPRGPGQMHDPRRLLRIAGRAARDASDALPVEADQPAGPARGRVPLPAGATGTRLQQLRAGAAVAARELHVGFP